MLLLNQISFQKDIEKKKKKKKNKTIKKKNERIKIFVGKIIYFDNNFSIQLYTQNRME